MKFYPPSYTIPTVMWCKNREESDRFREFLHNRCYAWASGESYLNYDPFKSYELFGNGMCYNFNQGTHGSLAGYERSDYEILLFEDFIWDDDISEVEENAMAIDTFYSKFILNLRP